MRFNIILHITTSCNYDCSYCDVIKDKKKLSKYNLDNILLFINKNYKNIDRFKFFGGEPLLVFDDIKYIIDKSKEKIGNNYEIVTNTSLLNNEIGEYFRNYFKIIFFSIDTENEFNYKKISDFIIKFNLEKKIYFNLVILPGKEFESLNQFKNLYRLGFMGFNILPVYFTKPWKKTNLEKLSNVIKYILDISIKDKNLRLYGFMENNGENISLANNTFFINIDSKVYYSDIISTFSGNNIKKYLYLGKLIDISLNKFIYYKFIREKESIKKLERKIYNKIIGQKQLHKIMDYFSEYLNKKINDKGYSTGKNKAFK